MVERKKFPISVLIVDDEPSIVEQLAMILGRRVEVFFTAFNGAEGYECYQRELPDLIISDIDMPVMNGIEFLKRVREHDRHVPFILSTGLKSLDILIQAIEQGITAFLPKPLQIQGLISKIEEVAHTKELEQEALQSSLLLDQYKKIVDNAVIVSKADMQGKITFVNDMFCSISGYTREELIGQPHNIVRDPDMPSEVFKQLWETIQSKQIWHGIIHNRAKNGSRYTVKSTIAPILDSNGNVIEYMGLREDITDLNTAKEEARLAAKIKGDFLANMSHEIRTPMNGILGFTDLLLRTGLNEQQRRYLGIIDKSTKSLLSIVNDILDFSKIESGKLELNATLINPSIEFVNMAQLFTSVMAEKQIEFEVLVDSKIASALFMDILRVQQVVSNLLSNAVKFTPQGGKITFYVSLTRTIGDEVTLRMGVRDNGIGISQSHQQKIFDAFSQADTSITRKYGGTGLGLSISSDLVELMGGKLKVESEEGKGSHFYFDFRVKTSDKPVEKVKTMNPKVLGQFSGNVLVAEDNEVNQELITEYLQQYHINSMMVGNGQDALEELASNTYDLILMDINMPVMSGTEAIALIRGKGILIPVIALTANAMEGDRQKYLEHGFDSYLTKPIVPNELQAVLETYLFQVQTDQALQAKPSRIVYNPSESILNIEMLLQELDLPENIVDKLLSAFLKSSQNNLNELKTAVEEKDFKKIENAAHKVKGAAGNMRFIPIEQLANDIEILARAQTDEDYTALYCRFEKKMNQVQEEIKTRVGHTE